MLILDFYVDEPACFGVPPYLSPYCRYAAGALVEAGIAPEEISYLTVDDWRREGKELRDEPRLVILIAGATVPGKYLGGKIGTVGEILEFLDFRRNRQPGSFTLIGGPIRQAAIEIKEEIRQLGGILIEGDPELYISEMVRALYQGMAEARGRAEALNRFSGGQRSYEEVDRFARSGAFISALHPRFPRIIIELESSRGCTRNRFCSFCTEPIYGKAKFRPVRGIVEEVAELHALGNRYFRLGRQADLLTYQADLDDRKGGFPRPSPRALGELYAGIRQAAPDLKMLHLDNFNPAVLSRFPDESREILNIICQHNTPGDTAAFGLESADPVVLKKNDIDCSPEEALRAVELVNEIGARRSGGIPRLLPGINLLHGLPGESDITFQRNYEFLKEILDRGLLLRRINIRQVTEFPQTRLHRLRARPDLESDMPRKRRRPAVLKEKFRHYRDRIRHEIDHPMLERCFPPGTRIDEVIPEAENRGFLFGRPLGSYPVTLKIPRDENSDRRLAEQSPLDLLVVGARERSLVALPRPVRLNKMEERQLTLLPGIGKKVAARISAARPLSSFGELLALTEGAIPGEAEDYDFSD